MLAILNKRWLAHGWRVMNPDDSEIMALAWIEILNRHDVPPEHYFELYRRSVDLRAQRLNSGLECDDFSVDMLIACWSGRFGLRSELEQKRIDAGNILTETAASQCPRCDGLNKEAVYDDTGRRLGVKSTCDHRPIVEGEGIWKYLTAAKEAAKARMS